MRRRRGLSACVQAAHNDENTMERMDNHGVSKLGTMLADFNSSGPFGPFCRIVAAGLF
jgi:hypothetical protein